MSLIEVKNLNLHYNFDSENPVHALADINLDIAEHEFVVILGASGCGKSTLLNILAGFLFTDDGEAKINQKLITKPGPDRGVVFQKNALMPWLNVKDNISMGLDFQKIDQSEQDEIIDKVLEWVSLSEFKDSYIYELSGGMQQRVGIARALANDPEILLMDEPLGALDAITREDIQTVILDVWKQTQKTILMITHSIEEALFMATRLIIMTPRPGKIYKTYELNFSKEYLAGKAALDIKKDPRFQDIKNEIITIIKDTSQ
jgi:taurine transport system ATP-binding protein